MSRRQKRLRVQRRRAVSLRHAAAGGSGLAVVATLLSGSAAHAALPPSTVEVTSDSGAAAWTNATTQLDPSGETLADAIAFADRNFYGGNGTTKITFASDLSGSTGQTIELDSSDHTFDLTEPITIDGSGANVTIDGGYGGASPLDGELFYIYQPSAWPTGTNAAFDDITLTGGGGGGAWAGAINDKGPLTISGSTITNNGFSYSGALYAGYAPLTVTDSTVTGNTGYAGGGIEIEYADSSLTLKDSIVSDNLATYGGAGITAGHAASVTISGSTVAGNSSYDGFAGVLIQAYGATGIADSTISGNATTYGNGGGVYVEAQSTTIENTTIAGNYCGNTTNGVGGLQVGSDATLVGDTITGNTAPASSRYSGGVTAWGGATLALDNSIVAGNTLGGSWDSGSGTVTPGSVESDVWSSNASGGSPVDGIGSSFSLIGNAGDIDSSGAALTPGAGDRLTDGTAVLNPGLSPLETVVAGKPQVMVPQPGSPALDTGDAGSFANAVTDGLKTDELGAARPTVLGWSASLPGDGTDIGAVELGALEIPAPGVSGLSPNSGPAGTTITIDGSNFWSTPTVTVGGVAATNVKLVSSTQITAEVPSGVSGTVDVTVETGSGTSASTSADRFTYPTVIPISTPGPTAKAPTAKAPKTRSKAIRVGDQRLKLTIPAGSFKKNSKIKLTLTDRRLEHGTKAKVKQVVFTLGKHKLTAHSGNTTKSLSTKGLTGHKTLQARVTLTETVGKGRHRHTKRVSRSIRLTITIG